MATATKKTAEPVPGDDAKALTMKVYEKLCRDYLEGKARDEYKSLESITRLYEALRE